MRSYAELMTLTAAVGGSTFFVGRTEAGYKIPAIKKGKGRKLLLVGGIHAREYITTYLVLRLFQAFRGGCELTVLPALNIDGILLSKLGEKMFSDDFARLQPTEVRSKLTEERRRYLCQVNGGTEFSQWKANLNCVDLNTNFPAKWGEGKQNVFYPAPSDYVGTCVASEKETQAVIGLLKRERYDAVIAYHSKGEEVYYGFDGNYRDADFAFAVADYLGYEAKTTEGSCGGIKDYVVLEGLGRGLTIEVGDDRLTHPIKEESLPEIECKHLGSLESICGLL